MKLQFPEKRPKHDSRTYFFLTLGLLTKDETAETTVRNLFSPFLHSGFLVGQTRLISVLTHLVHQNLMQKPKINL